MSLNATEQLVFDYIQTHPEERQYWLSKVQKTSGAASDIEAAASIEPDLWRYFEERSAVASPFKELAKRQGIRRTSMRNLAEHMVRLWSAPRPKRRDARTYDS